MSTSLKPIFDLLAKMSRTNKDRQIGNDILELQRQVKGMEKVFNDLFNNRVQSGLEIERLKQEIGKLKKGEAPTPSFRTPAPAPAPAPATAQPAPQPRQGSWSEDVLWHSGNEKKS